MLVLSLEIAAREYVKLLITIYRLLILEVVKKTKTRNPQIINCDYKTKDIVNAILNVEELDSSTTVPNFGSGNSAEKNILKVLNTTEVWQIEHQKQFRDLQ